MYFLGWDFIILSLLLLGTIFTLLYIFREQIKQFVYGKSKFDGFSYKIKSYLETTYPEIKFEYSIFEESKKEPNPTTRKYLVIDNILNQFLKIQLNKENLPKPISKELQWGSYTFNCEPNRDKLPKDWEQRKNALLIRDNKKCFRCSKKLTISTIQIYMLRPISEGGKYFLENLIPVCRDCNKILNKKENYLDIKDELNHIVETSS